MSDLELKKLQTEEPRTAEGLPADVIVSPDTHRSNRIPPGQSRTRKWPVLDAGGPPRIDMEKWRLEIHGLVDKEASFNWAQFQQLPRTKVFSDFHCVTRWSRLGNIWEGVSTRDLMQTVGTTSPRARYVLVHGYDFGWTTNLPLDQFLSEDSLIATHHDGEPLSLEHGAPARLIVPRLYAWKSAKWVGGIEFIEQDKAGFWERNGYHMNGDPWREERFGY
ncbi:sulfite oxidase-like oxidoreductase [uncultured Paludibaculum sp.]|uniref:sulfite oxidase-like oxidoreductase n=1 Tax=uncultured Paludibaculum sp. TaxID=1765020 RepID=UPI002AABE308|nr:sulfite oxidase-like oxidoreductase [uncultured Paludibaculum sp.]